MSVALAHYDLELHQIDRWEDGIPQWEFARNPWHNPTVLSWKKRTYGMLPEEIHLWIKITLKIVVFEVAEMIK